jgi:hypothetical protein
MNILPDGFAALAPFVGQWDRATMSERAAQRSGSSAVQRDAFFEAGFALFEPAMALLDRKPLAALDASEQRLLNLMMALSHVSLAVEIQREDEAKHAPQRAAMRITRGVLDGPT